MCLYLFSLSSGLCEGAMLRENEVRTYKEGAPQTSEQRVR